MDGVLFGGIRLNLFGAGDDGEGKVSTSGFQSGFFI
jgi:hypothetical protein